MLKFNRRLEHLRKGQERGSADVITMLFLLPILLLLMFSMIDLSFYLSTKSTVQAVTRDGARQVAMWGGDNSSLRNGKKPSQNIKEALQHSNGACKPSVCPKGKPPKVTCSPKGRTSKAGQEVSCTVTYTYNSVVGNFSLFGAVINKPFKITQYARAETQGLK